MRVIGGKLRGKSINFLKSKKTRPLKDSVRENIFNILMHSNLIKVKVDNANILDLYSGIGSFGIECISRGARKVVFLENYSKILNILKKNINLINANKNCDVIEKNCFDFFLKKNLFQNKFDLVFLDPPYKEERFNILINKIKDNKILENNGILIIHRHKKDSLKISEKINIIDERVYGISKIIIAN